ncbi:SDR family NAD(P)-dependent oxidoreductase, partial [Sandarakinorhabdus limnophila]|uniref:SDR family NAD(P)-dependent oxidoreductase n=1 Tax=Sandarakinorhabdus limnophila TaxID=210512 RepID=UPI0026EA01F3
MTMDAERFAGRTAIITGGASGLGRATALRIVAEGGRVALWDRNKEMLREAQAEIGASHVVALDVSDATAVAEAALSSGAALGRVDILVNSAGITGASVPVVDFPLEDWRRVIEINLNGVFYCCRQVVPLM